MERPSRAFLASPSDEGDNGIPPYEAVAEPPIRGRCPSPECGTYCANAALRYEHQAWPLRRQLGPDLINECRDGKQLRPAILGVNTVDTLGYDECHGGCAHLIELSRRN